MKELMTKSLAQIVNNNHLAASVFEKYHLDFCCKGKRTLQQACTESELPVAEIVSELEKTTQQNSDKVCKKRNACHCCVFTKGSIQTWCPSSGNAEGF
jgi:iron-sulfur cluster repair protein YtfE (RIC family)